MTPLNNRLKDEKVLMEEVVAENELKRWSRLHLVRTVLSVIGFAALVYL